MGKFDAGPVRIQRLMGGAGCIQVGGSKQHAVSMKHFSRQSALQALPCAAAVVVGAALTRIVAGLALWCAACVEVCLVAHREQVGAKARVAGYIVAAMVHHEGCTRAPGCWGY